jgi:hypothetical protein
MNVISIIFLSFRPCDCMSLTSLATKPNGIETLNLYHNLTKENL